MIPKVYVGSGNVWGSDFVGKKPIGTSTTMFVKKDPKPKKEDVAGIGKQQETKVGKAFVGGGVSAKKVLAKAGLAMGSMVRMDGKGGGGGEGGGAWVIKPSRYILSAWKQRAEAAKKAADEAQKASVEAVKAEEKKVEERAVEEVEPIEPIEKPIEAVEEAEKIVEAVAEQPKAEEAVEAAVEAEAPVLEETAEVPTEAKGEVVGEERNLFGEVIEAESSSLSPTEERLTEYLGAAESAVAEVKAAEAARGGEPGGGNAGSGKKKRRKRKHRR